MASPSTALSAVWLTSASYSTAPFQKGINFGCQILCQKNICMLAGLPGNPLQASSKTSAAGQPSSSQSPSSCRASASAASPAVQQVKHSASTRAQASPSNAQAAGSTKKPSRPQPPQLSVRLANDSHASPSGSKPEQATKELQPTAPTGQPTAVGGSDPRATGHPATALSNGSLPLATASTIEAGVPPSTALSNGPTTAESTPNAQPNGAQRQSAANLNDGSGLSNGSAQPGVQELKQPPLRQSRTPESRKGAISWQQGPSLRDSLESAFSSIPLFSPDPMHKGPLPAPTRPLADGPACRCPAC